MFTCNKKIIFFYVIKPTNVHVYNVLSHIINYQYVSIAFEVIFRVASKG